MVKLIKDEIIIDVLESPKFIRFLPTGHIAMTDKRSAQGVIGSDDKTIYSFAPVLGKQFSVVRMIDISTKEELSRLKSLLSSGSNVSADEAPVAKAKKEKINNLSNQCKNIITAGFSVILSDGESHSFKLTVEDQLNLMMIENRLNAGDSVFIYHATNQPCKIFTRDDMYKIVFAFRLHVMYHTTYFNAAKQYITSLTRLEDINIFKYGDTVVDSVTDPIIKQILINGGVS